MPSDPRTAPAVLPAIDYLLAGFSCSQAMVMANAARYGLSEDTAARLAAGFAGGLARGDTCGAVAGAIMVLGLALADSTPKESYGGQICTLATVEFCRQFSSRHRSIQCREILKGYRVDREDPRQMKGLRASGLCTGIVRDAQSILRRLLEERPF